MTLSLPHGPRTTQATGIPTAAECERLVELYHQNAAQVLVTHYCVGRSCAACGDLWPCSKAHAAAFALDV